MAMEAMCINPNCNVFNFLNSEECFQRCPTFHSGGNHQDEMPRDLNSEMIRLVSSLSIPTEGIDSQCQRTSKVNSIQPSGNCVQPARTLKHTEEENTKLQPDKKKLKGDAHISRDNLSRNKLDSCPPYGMMSVVGRRPEMEDTIATVPSFYKGTSLPLSYDLHFFGVYDGHGGSEASVFCRERLHEALAEELRDLPPCDGPRDPSEWEKAMRNCFSEMDVQVGGMCPTGNCCYEDNTFCPCCKDRPVAPENVGTTAVVAVVSRSQIVVANCGDSRAVLCRGGKAIPFSNDHKPEREDEMNRIEAAGGQIVNWNGYRVGGFLAMTRAIGDRYLKQYVISEPEVSCSERTEEDELLILATDGLWDVVSNERACKIATKCLSGCRPRPFKGMNGSSAAVAANVLTRLGVAHGSSDNISVVVIDLHKKRQSEIQANMIS